MLLAALVDAGASLERLREVPGLLGLRGVEIEATRVERQGIGALHVTVSVARDSETRDYRAIRSLIEASRLEPLPRDRALEVFARLAVAEGRVHGVEPDEVHFHELGGVDALVDVCGVVVLLEDLGVERIVCSPLPVGRGLVKAAHGVLPLPAPATLELLRNAPLRGVDIEVELVTPTGAALAAVLADSWGQLPPLVLQRVGYGAGSRELSDRPNVVRVLLGETEAGERTAEVVLLETNLDDLVPELVPDAVERCFAAGALDVWTVPVQMKKGRPGLVLSALARPIDEQAVAVALLEETSALGVRVQRLFRYELEREEIAVELEGGSVRVKIGRLDRRVVNVAPEHDDCAALARTTGRSVKSVWVEALTAAHTQ